MICLNRTETKTKKTIEGTNSKPPNSQTSSLLLQCSSSASLYNLRLYLLEIIASGNKDQV